MKHVKREIVTGVLLLVSDILMMRKEEDQKGQTTAVLGSVRVGGLARDRSLYILLFVHVKKNTYPFVV